MTLVPIVALMLLTATLPTVTSYVPGPVMFAPPETVSATIDGVWSAGEWVDAPQYTMTGASGEIGYIRAKYNSTHLLVIIDSPWDTTPATLYYHENVWLAFDTLNDGGGVPQWDDKLVHATTSWTQMGWMGTGTNWTSTWLGAGFATVQAGENNMWPTPLQPSPNDATPHRITEMTVPLTHVGSPGSTVGFYAQVDDDSTDPDGTGWLPSTAYAEWPSGAGGSPGWPAGWWGSAPCPNPYCWGNLVLGAPPATFTPPSGWASWEEVTLTDAGWANHIDEPADILLTPAFGTCQSVDEIRVIAPDGVTEIPSQVYDVVTTAGYVTSCRVVFLANVPALGSATYYIIYNNPSATTPFYNGLRLYTVAPGDTYNVTANVCGVEKNYFYVAWMNLMDIYVNGVPLAQGNVFFGLGQMSPATMFSDVRDGNSLWFGAGKSLSVVNSGPVFVEFNYSEAYATDFWGLLPPNYNVTYTCMLRIYFQPNLHPLIRYDSTFTIKTNLDWWALGGPVYMDFKFANSSFLELYQSITYSQGWFGTTSLPTSNTTLPWTSIYFPPWGLYGWWTLNGSRSDSSEKPVANLGFIPVSHHGTANETLSGGYQSSFYYQTESGGAPAVHGEHHNGQWMVGVYNGTYGDTAGLTGYITTYGPVDGNIQPLMDNKAAALRTPLGVGFKPSLTGDTNKDWYVNIVDIVRAAIAFGSTPGHPKWNPDTDLNDDDLIDIVDLVTIGINFGAKDP
jgi:hypothetical protein